MNPHKFTAGIVLGLVLTLNACSGEMQTMTPTHVVQLNLAPSRYIEFVEKLDLEMKAIGLSRFGAAPGLKELRGRDAIYFAYKKCQKTSGRCSMVLPSSSMEG